MKVKKVIVLLIVVMFTFNSSINKGGVYANNLYSEEYISKQEMQFMNNDYLGSGENDYKYKSGTIPVLISAPHTVKQWRDNQYKGADVYTGALVKALQKSTGAHIIYKTSSNGDENYTNKETAYRKKIKSIVRNNDIKVIIDLHGMLSYKKSDIDIGTGNSSNINLLGQKYILSLIKNSFIESNYSVNKYFTGGGPNTISTYCSKNLGVPTVQFEINGKYRSTDSKKFTYMVNTLTKAINNLSKRAYIPEGKVVNVKKYISLRSSKSSANNKNVIRKINAGSSVTILDNINDVRKDNKWIRVKYNNKIGYVKSNYISLYKVGKIVNVNSSIRLRKNMNANSSTVSRIPKGAYVNILKSGKIYKVKYNNRTGYINEKYIK